MYKQHFIIIQKHITILVLLTCVIWGGGGGGNTGLPPNVPLRTLGGVAESGGGGGGGANTGLGYD